MISLTGNYQTVFQSDCAILQSLQPCRRVRVLHILLSTWCCQCLLVCHYDFWEWQVRVVVVCLFIMTEDVDYPSVCLFVICRSLMECLFKSFVHLVEIRKFVK